MHVAEIDLFIFGRAMALLQPLAPGSPFGGGSDLAQ